MEGPNNMEFLYGGLGDLQYIKANKSHTKTPEHHTHMRIKYRQHMHTDYTHTYTLAHITHTNVHLPQLQLTIYMPKFIGKSQKDEKIESVVLLVVVTLALSSQVNGPFSAIRGTRPWACKTHERRERWGTLWSIRISILDT